MCSVPRRQTRPGQSLVEFSLVALVLFVLLAAAMEMGRAMYGAETLQAAADLGAREISRTPLKVTYTSLYGTGPNDPTAALNDSAVRQRVFDERLLVIDLDQNGITKSTDPEALNTLFASFPIVNQQLRTLMIYDNLSLGRNLLRYPGALVKKGDESAVTQPVPDRFTDSELRVAIPVIDSRGGSGVETVHWATVVEEIKPGAFSVTSDGVVGVRLNYPFQAATLSGYQTGPNGPFEPGTVIKASDGSVKATGDTPGGGLAVGADPDAGTDKGLQPYGGEYGLGFQLEQIPGSKGASDRVRPFRSLLSAQAVYRRELFTPGS